MVTLPHEDSAISPNDISISCSRSSNQVNKAFNPQDTARKMTFNNKMDKDSDDCEYIVEPNIIKITTTKTEHDATVVVLGRKREADQIDKNMSRKGN